MDQKATASAFIVDAQISLGRWRSKTRWGIVSQAAYDEDAVTMAARCGLAMLDRNRDITPTGLMTATVSAPLPEPGMAPFLAEMLDIRSAADRPGPDVLELAGSVSSGVAAVAEAARRVTGGRGPVLVVVSDDRRDTKGRPLGAAAVALLIDSVGDVGSVTPAENGAELFLDRWQRSGTPGVQAGDRSLDRYSPAQGFADGLDADRVLLSTGFGPQIEGAGFPGCAAPLIGLFASDATEGRDLVVASSAGGISHAVRITVGSRFSDIREQAVDEISGGLRGKRPADPDESTFTPYSSQAMAYRERSQTFRLLAARNTETGGVVFPPPPAASSAGFEPFHLARTGTVVTFARDHMFPLGGPLSMAVVELDGGGRFYGQVADRLEVEIGDRVELVLRRLHDGGDVPNYFWKIQAATTWAT
ncbi:MAG: OB-fold domain-containing protein [bacterium]|nr:OB-fold domain-containing protein [bacterium]